MPVRPPIAQPTIATERCIIRPAVLGDLPFMQSAFDAPEFPARLPLSEMHRNGRLPQWLQRTCQSTTDDRPNVWSIDLKSGAPCIGQIALPVRPDHGDRALAFWLAPQAWGQGLARESVAAVLDHVFLHTGVTHVWAAAAVWNTPSLALLRALGFVQTGETSGYLIDGEPQAALAFSLSKINEPNCAHNL